MTKLSRFYGCYLPFSLYGLSEAKAVPLYEKILLLLLNSKKNKRAVSYSSLILNIHPILHIPADY